MPQEQRAKGGRRVSQMPEPGKDQFEMDELDTLDGPLDPSWDEGDDDRARYVEPTWTRGPDDDPDEQLRKCASCNRFFVERCPLILFLGDGRKRGECLNLEICSLCAGPVLKARRILR